MRIQVKILLLILLQLLVVFAAMTAVTLQIGRKTIREESRIGLSDDLVTFNQSAGAFLRERKGATLNPALQKLMKDPQVVYFVLQDDRGTILFSRSKAPGMATFMKKTALPVGQEKILLAGATAHVGFFDFQNQPITEMWQAVLAEGKCLGYVRLGVDDRAVEATMEHFSKSAVNRMLAIDLVIILLVVLFTTYVVRRLSEPLDHFQKKINHTLTRFAPGSHAVGSGLSDLSLNDIADRFETAMQEIVVAQNERMDWVSTLSHEFRSPLQAIKGYAEYIRNGHTGPITPKTEHILSLIVSGSAHFEDFINQILDLVRLETGKLELSLGPVQLRPLLEESAHFYQMEAPKQGLSLVLDLATDLPVVQGDASSIHRVVTNLLSNAFKFTPPGGTITLRATRREGGVLVCIQDTGVGIHPKDVGRIFDKFFQSQTEYRTPGQAKGLGIGLAVCKMLVEAQKGRVWAESEQGSGTRIYFTLDEGRGA